MWLSNYCRTIVDCAGNWSPDAIPHRNQYSDEVHSATRNQNTGLSKKMDGIWNRYNLKSTGRIYTFGVLNCLEKFKVLDLP